MFWCKYDEAGGYVDVKDQSELDSLSGKSENAGKGNPNHDPKTGRFATGPGGSSGGSEENEDTPKVNGHRLNSSSSKEEVKAFVESLKGKTAVDRTREVYDALGYNDVSKSFKGGSKLYRYETGNTVEESKKYKDEIMAKKRRFPESGNNMFGVGNYFGESKDGVSFYKKENSVLVEGRLDSSTKIADFKEIHNLRSKFFNDHSDLISENMVYASVFSEYGLVAAMQGYGAIRTDGGYIVVLDRRKLNVD